MATWLGDALLAAVFRPRDRAPTVAFQQALNLFPGAPRRHAVMSTPGEGYLKMGWLDAYSLRIAPTSHFRINADAIVLTNRKPMHCACREALRRSHSVQPEGPRYR